MHFHLLQVGTLCPPPDTEVNLSISGEDRSLRSRYLRPDDGVDVKDQRLVQPEEVRQETFALAALEVQGGDEQPAVKRRGVSF